MTTLREFEKLSEAIDHVQAYPSVYNQKQFISECGTKFCLAGHILLRECNITGSGAVVRTDYVTMNKLSLLYLGVTEGEFKHAKSPFAEMGVHSIIATAAAKIIGLHPAAAMVMFFRSDLTMRAIRLNRDLLANDIRGDPNINAFPAFPVFPTKYVYGKIDLMRRVKDE